MVRSAILCLFVLFFSGCWLFGDQETTHFHLTKNIYLSRSGAQDNQFITNNFERDKKAWQANVLINRYVYAVGYTNQYIIAKQLNWHQLKWYDSTQTTYYIIDARNTPKVYTCDNETEFNSHRRLLGVPDTLSFFFRPHK